MNLTAKKWPAAVSAGRCERLGLAVVGVRPTRRGPVVTVVCPHCRGRRRVTAWTLKGWCEAGRVKRCHGGTLTAGGVYGCRRERGTT